MKNILSLILLLTISTAYSQHKKLLNIFSVTKNIKIGFTSYDKEFKMYQKPVIIRNGKKYKIQGYDNQNYSEGGTLGISPNKNFIVLDYIIKGYVEDGVTRRLHENYLCVIIDLYQRKVVMQMQDGCAGNWNNKNEWIYDDKVIFDGK